MLPVCQSSCRTDISGKVNLHQDRGCQNGVLYHHLSGLVTRSTSVATIRPTIKGAGIIWPLWLQTTHGVVPENRGRAATAPISNAPRFTPDRSQHAFCRILSDGFLQSSVTNCRVRQM